MVYVVLVHRSGRPNPSVYVEQGSTPSIVPEGCRRGVKLYTQGRAFELVYGATPRAREALAGSAAKLWTDHESQVADGYTRDNLDTVQIHAL